MGAIVAEARRRRKRILRERAGGPWRRRGRSRRRYSGIATLTRKKRVAPLVEVQFSSSSVFLPSTR